MHSSSSTGALLECAGGLADGTCALCQWMLGKATNGALVSPLLENGKAAQALDIPAEALKSRRGSQ